MSSADPLPLLTSKDFESLCLGLLRGEIQLIDVRAPIEFDVGSIPHSLNSPILNTEERALVGTTYKKNGSDAATELGHQLVSGDVKLGRVKQWQELASQKQQTVITCFRGGLRSKITQTWLKETGLTLPRVEGGYKALRQFLIDQIENFSSGKSLLVVSGATGAAKTRLLREPTLQSRLPVLDLELAANHRGSAFGGFVSPQPSQINFENHLAFQIVQRRNEFSSFTSGPVLIEDESRLIGRCVQPQALFDRLRESPVVLIDEPLEQRVLNTYDEYVLRTDLSVEGTNRIAALPVFDRFFKALDGISNRLGGARHQEIKKDLEQARERFLLDGSLEENKVWIYKLLSWYYDPMYMQSLDKRQPKIQFRGTYAEVLSHLTC